jgi:hypothetical protein
MLKLRTLLTVNSLVGIAFGVALLAAPGLLLRLYGLPGDTTALLFARLVGAELLGINVPTWMARTSPGGPAAAFAVIGHALSETLGFGITLAAALAGFGNQMVWSVVAIYGLFAVGNLYFIFAAGMRVR